MFSINPILAIFTQLSIFFFFFSNFGIVILLVSCHPFLPPPPPPPPSGNSNQPCVPSPSLGRKCDSIIPPSYPLCVEPDNNGGDDSSASSSSSSSSSSLSSNSTTTLIFTKNGEKKLIPITETGICSWYTSSSGYAITASEEIFDPNSLTAAHKYLPYGTMVRVRINSRLLTVRINDRSAPVPGRILDLTPKAARLLGLLGGNSGGDGMMPCSVTLISRPDGKPIQSFPSSGSINEGVANQDQQQRLQQKTSISLDPLFYWTKRYFRKGKISKKC